MNSPHHPSLELPQMSSLDTPHAPQAGARPQPTASKQVLTFEQAVASGVTGEVLGESLDVSMVIGTEDLIEGKIKTGKGKSIVIRGTVIGAVECQGRVVILPGGRVLGSIKATALWVEGDVGESKNPSSIDVGDLHLGVNSRVVGTCIYDSMGMALPNRGVHGQLIPRAEQDSENA